LVVTIGPHRRQGGRGDVKALIAYFWPFAAYRDVERGSMLERAAAWRHNRQLSNSLPRYINRWAVCVALELILLAFPPLSLTPVLGILLTITFCGLLHIVSIWLLFRRQ
jgi:hypothetical protein